MGQVSLKRLEDSEMEVYRPGLLSFTGYFLVVIGWLGVISGCISWVVFVIALLNGSTSDLLLGTCIFGGFACLGFGCFSIGTGKGVLNGSQVARIFATLASLLFSPTIVLTVLFLIGLFSTGSENYFRYHQRKKNLNSSPA